MVARKSIEPKKKESRGIKKEGKKTEGRKGFQETKAASFNRGRPLRKADKRPKSSDKERKASSD